MTWPLPMPATPAAPTERWTTAGVWADEPPVRPRDRLIPYYTRIEFRAGSVVPVGKGYIVRDSGPATKRRGRQTSAFLSE